MSLLAFIISTIITLTLAVTVQINAQQSQPPVPTVTTQQGTIQGIQVLPNVHAYLGVPYAQPPVGQNAYRYAQYPPSSYTYSSNSSSYNGTYSKARCTGISGGALFGADDCLYVDIWKPSNATANDRLPVYVFIPYVSICLYLCICICLCEVCRCDT
jgi:hypothetical protein